jgi:pimeloyl-ACP methyl ester carboxylesterase
MTAISSSEDVRFRSAGVSLAGTFVDPGDAKAAALTLTGSGRLDRDSNTRGFRGEINSAIAEALAARGVACLRYDKRGAGESGGDFYATSMSDNYADAAAAVDWLRARASGLPIYAIGHSEGALHVAHLAAEEKVAGAVLIACPARRGEEILTWQAAQIVPTLPATTRAILKLLHIDPLKSQRKAIARIRSTSAPILRIQGKKLNARWFREFIDYDPVPVLKRVRVPVLVVVAGHDMQIPPEDGNAICRLVAGPCDAVIVPDLSHVLRDDPAPKGPRGYRKAVKAAVSPVVLDAVADWVEQGVPQPSRLGERGHE